MNKVLTPGCLPLPDLYQVLQKETLVLLETQGNVYSCTQSNPKSRFSKFNFGY